MNQLLTAILKQNRNDGQLKQIILLQTMIREKLAFHFFTSSNQTYLQAFGISYHDHDKFNYIGQLLHQRSTVVIGKIKRRQVCVNQTASKPRVEQQQMKKLELTEQMKAEVEEVLNNVDLPLSLFKRNDRYWSRDNPKTIEARQYIKKMQQQQRKFKFEAMKKSQRIRQQKQKTLNESIDHSKIQQNQRQRQIKQQMKKKIDDIKSNAQERKRRIEESIQFQRSLKPLYKTIEKRYHDKFEAPSLQQRKRKLSQIRQLRKSVDLLQIAEHKKKLDKLKQQHEQVKIIDDPLKLPFKSKFHKQLLSQMNPINMIQSRIKSLYQKKMEYGKVVKEEKKPKIDQKLAHEIQERLKIMKKRRVRVYKKKQEQPKETGDSDQDDQQEEEQEEQPEPSIESQPQDQDSESQPKPVPQRDDQYDPDRKQRYKMGLNYLSYAKSHKKKEINQGSIQQTQTVSNDLEIKTHNRPKIKKNITISFDKNNQKSGDISLDKNKQRENDVINQEKTQKSRYKDYLRQMSKTSKTNDHYSLDTQSLNRQLQNKEAIKNSPGYSTTVERKMRKVYQKAIYQEQLLKYENGSAQQKMKKKHQVDNAVVATIKARLALMNSKK